MKKLLTISIILTAIIVLAVNFLIYKEPKAEADSATTSVEIQNIVPAFSGNAAESTASTATAPTNVGGSITFQATATDTNGDQWKLLICKTSGTSGTDCDGGASDRWCVASSFVNSGSQSTCSYTTQAGDGWSNAWFAYGCDATGCTATANQGTGDSGTPFYTNHAPAFSSGSDDSGKNPGQTVTWSTTSSDTDTSATVTLYVCKTASFTSGASPACDGGEWCHSTASASNATCGYELPSVYPDANYSSYVYIVDQFGFVSAGTAQGTDTTLTVNNVAPSITASGVSLLDTDGSGDMTLTTSAGDTTGFKVTFTVTDNNSCETSASGNEISSAFVNVYRSGVTSASCDESANYDVDKCYPDASASWTPSCSQDVGTCSGTTDSDAAWTCTFPLGYTADPTVANSTYAAENWLASVQATDDDSANTGLVEASTGTEMGMFLSYDVTTESISYGALNPGGDSTETSTVMQAKGNVGVDEQLSGTNMTSGENTIVVGQQKYNLTASQGWTAGTALTTSPAEAELNVAKPKTGALTPTSSTYWVLRVPAAQATCTYSGTNTITGLTSESAGW